MLQHFGKQIEALIDMLREGLLSWFGIATDRVHNMYNMPTPALFRSGYT